MRMYVYVTKRTIW